MPSIELTKIAAVAAGGALGASGRLLCGTWVAGFAGKTFPWGTLLVNVAGSFLIGLVYVALVERMRADPLWIDLLIVGVLGGFTTFSAFSLDTVTMLGHGQFGAAAGYVVGSVVVCLAATACALWLARLV